MNSLIEKIIDCGTRKKDLVDNIAGYIQDSVVYIAVLKQGKNWGYIVLELNDEEDENFIKELDEIDKLAVIMQGYEMGNTSKSSISNYITNFRNMYKENLEGKNNTWTKEKIKDLLLNNDKAVLKGIIVIYEFQTEDEKIMKTTTNTLNGVGFNRYDSEILSSFAEQILKNRKLSKKQMNIARKKIIKYASQLANFANNKNN